MGGVLVYATCSVLKIENESQVQQFIVGHDDAEEIPIHATWGVAQKVGRQILTGDEGMDGFFYARIGKKK
jgi:16S rRNA (cytosine967-C5)-methyltransferase